MEPMPRHGGRGQDSGRVEPCTSALYSHRPAAQVRWRLWGVRRANDLTSLILNQSVRIVSDRDAVQYSKPITN